MSDFRNDLKYSLRMLVANPAFTLTAVAALALGIGANTAIFTVVDTVLLKPLTYPDAERIVRFMNTSPNGRGASSSPVNFNLWRAQTSVFENVAAYDFGGPGFNLTGTVPEQVHGIHVSEGYFRLFGAPVLLGRTFTPQEDSPDGGHVVVISYGFWQRRFGGNPKVVGSAISLSNENYTIIGVLGKSFVTDPPADLWVPFQIDANSTNLGHYFFVSGRLKPGVTLDQANAELKLAADQYRRLYPQDMGPKDGFGVEPLRDSIVAGARTSLLVLLGAVSFVLLIACANVANLLLARAAGRKREFAIRAAMGARPLRIMRQLLTESVVLAMTGGILGLVLGYAGVRGLLAVSPAGLPRVGEHGAAVSVDWRVLAFTLGVSLLTGILFGLFPAIGASRPDLNTTLKESSNRSGTGFRQGKARALLVISEVSLALVLLIGAALLIRTYIALRNVNPGFDAHDVLTLEMSLTGDRFMKTAGVAQVARDARERLDAIPGVEESAFSCCLPLNVGYGLPFNIIGRPTGKSPWTGGSSWMSASPGYFSVFKIPIVRGRDFNEHDDGSAPGVVLINETFAKKYWGNQNPLGQQMLIGKGMGPQFTENPRQVIGVVADVHDGGLNRDPFPLMIVPSAQVTDGLTKLNASIQPMIWMVRTHGDPHQYITAITQQLRLASGGFPVAHVQTMDDIVIQSTARQNFNMLLLTIFGAVALILAAIGIYGLMAYSVQQRTQEMGIRMALGADRGRIRDLVVWQGMRLAIIGVVLGIAAGFGLTRFLASFLFGVKTWDPLVFATVPVVLSAVALLAVWFPATRAARLDPQQALRIE
ncbi:MAG TPA: ABC transporter permease [Terracidiphilus sp.]|nr:ABC transporter permease [Terracidiphilus sp.]